MESIRVVLADDSTEFRPELAAYLKTLPGIEIAGEGKDGFLAAYLTRTSNSDLVLLDIHDTAGLVRYAVEKGLLSIAAR